MAQTPLPAPGALVHRDCRKPDSKLQCIPGKPVRLVQWNIERGYELDAVTAELKQLDADIIALQEVDAGCERSGCLDTGLIIAEALQLNYLFVCEFEELRSSLRDARSQGGGVHGNALLSRFDMHDVRVIEHRHHPVDWNQPQHPLAQKEPRKGRRFILAATVACPDGPLLCYCLHLEVFCGMLARIAQFADVLRDSKEQLAKGLYHQAILGDLNTMAHGIARLSGNYCCDKMRIWSLGQSEAGFWHRNVLSVRDSAWDPAKDASQVADPARAREAGTTPGVDHLHPDAPAVEQATGTHRSSPLPRLFERPHEMNSKLQAWGVPHDICADVTNPGFHDPFHFNTTTLDNPSYRFFGISFMQGKLDWLLLRRLTAVRTMVGNHDYAASDHKWLAADVAWQ